MAADENYDTDEQLIAAFQCGDVKAFELLVRRHTGRFYAAAYRAVGQVQEAEDILQEAFLKLWRDPSVFDAERGVSFTTWFYTVVLNTARDALRKKFGKPVSEMPEEVADVNAPSQLEMLQMREEEARIETAIQSLPERQKYALNLCYYEGVSNKEAAQILNVSVKALESLLMRAKTALKTILLAPSGEDDERERRYG